MPLAESKVWLSYLYQITTYSKIPISLGLTHIFNFLSFSKVLQIQDFGEVEIFYS